MLTPFDSQLRTRIVFGADSLGRLGELAASLNASRVLLVTDTGIVRAGHAARAAQFLRDSGRTVTTFDQVEENPTTRCVDACLQVARKENVDLFVAIGGGSPIDTAKGCNFLLTNGGAMRDYWGSGKARLPLLPLIAIPTTAGTGSECQSFALISDASTHQKMACGDPKAAPAIAILDPVLTVSQPAAVTACTGIDAIAHALESAVTKKRTPVSALFARESFRLAMDAFPRVLASPADLDARGAMQLAAAWAGLAIENSMLGAAHSAANPLTARYGVVHGQAVGLMLPHVLRFNSAEPAAMRIYTGLASDARIAPGQNPAESLASRIEELLALARLPRTLAQFGVSPGDIPTLAEAAASQWTAQYNPRLIGAPDFERLYSAALG